MVLMQEVHLPPAARANLPTLRQAAPIHLPGLGNAWITSAHYRTGILMGPATGSALARWIASGQRPAHTEPWAIHRHFSS